MPYYKYYKLPTIRRAMKRDIGTYQSPYEQPMTKVKNNVPKNSAKTLVESENF